MRAAGLAVAVAAAALAALGAACTAIHPFACERDDQCAPGRCEPSGSCSFADPSCAAGWRYGNRSEPGVAGQCVGAEGGDVVQVAAGSEHACARTQDGALYCWGANKYGALGRAGGDANVPEQVAGVAGVEDLDGGTFHTCVVAGGVPWCWGADAQGELGRGDATADPVPTPAPVTGLGGVTRVDLGAYVSCALDDAGKVWCWGRGKDGEDGQVDPSYQTEPVGVAVPAARAVAAGGQEGCAIAQSGDVWCWGKNDSGQLGVPGVGRTRPTAVPAFAGATQVVVGAAHACALFADGRARCTGADDHGQLGDGTTTTTHTPVDVAGLTDAVELAALGASTCARRQGGAVVCWGEGDHGELGSGAADSLVPVAVPLPGPATQLAAGQSFACALTADGCVACWGLDTNGQLGDGAGAPGGVRRVLLGSCAATPAR